jgi:hypothetical protein
VLLWCTSSPLMLQVFIPYTSQVRDPFGQKPKSQDAPRVGFGSGSVREVVQPIRAAIGSAPAGRRQQSDGQQQQQQQQQQRRAVIHTQQAGPLSPVHKEVRLPSHAVLLLPIASFVLFFTTAAFAQIKRVGARVKDLASDVGDLMQSLQVHRTACAIINGTSTSTRFHHGRCHHHLHHSFVL